MTTQLIKLNPLSMDARGVWANQSDDLDFDYSDGADEEHFLIEVLQQANDLSLDSPALRRACRDWVAEYHLSAVRANLLRPIDLSPEAKILEVGCGCGAITRYLGERGCNVDAIEGSAKRAEISALRCRDLDNVYIIQHNFNALILPDNHYQAVIFIGVLEYARRFLDSNDMTAEQAVSEILDKAAASLTENGVIIVAIENRTGLKYKKGAYEDHLALPGVGVNNYQGYEYTGIKTYDSTQWQNILAGVKLHHRLFFPFPDYKFPNLVISGNVDENHIAYLANQIRSHDPISPWIYPGQESQKWTQIISTGNLCHAANSFGLVIARNAAALEKILPNAWTLFDCIEIKEKYRIEFTNGKHNKNINNNNDLYQLLNHSLKIKTGLVSIWRSELMQRPDPEMLVQLATRLRGLLEAFWPQNKLVDIDQLFADESQNQLEHARCWVTQTKISVEQQLFHVLLGFLTANHKFLAHHGAFNLLSHSDLVSECMNIQDHAPAVTGRLAESEDEFRDITQICPAAVSDELAFIISGYDKYRFTHVNAQIFWSSRADIFTADQCMTKRVKQTINIQTVLFNNINSINTHLRFDPCDHEYGNGYYFCLHAVTITGYQENSILNLQGGNIEKYLSGSHDLVTVDASRFIFKVNGIDPQIKFSLPEELHKITDRYHLKIKLQWLGT